MEEIEHNFYNVIRKFLACRPHSRQNKPRHQADHPAVQGFPRFNVFFHHGHFPTF